MAQTHMSRLKRSDITFKFEFLNPVDPKDLLRIRAQSLVEYLNNPKSETTGVTRMHREMLNIQRLQEENPGLMMPWEDQNKAADEKFLAAKRQHQQVLRRLNRQLRTYQASPCIFPSLKIRGRWVNFWQSPMGVSRKLADEMELVLRLIEIAENGYLDRIRRCRMCASWFVAQTSHQEHCDTKCQQRKFRSKPEFRARRRQYMRDLRALHSQKLFREVPRRTRSQK
jgi:hypothetical protein